MERITIPRRLTQTLFFLLTGQWLVVGFLRCPFGVPFVCCASCPLSDCTGTWLQMPVIGLLLISGILLGRVFCGWLCPLGYLQDVLGRLPKPSLEPRRWFTAVEPWLRALKYVVLTVVVWLVFRYNFPAERAHPYVVRSPSFLNWESIVVAAKLGATRYPVRAGILGVALLSGLLVTRLWCRYLCPLGALLGVLNKVSAWRPAKVEAACRNCGTYSRECVQHTLPGTMDCIVCGDCLQGCPHGAIMFRSRRPRMPRANADLEQEQENPSPC